MYFSNVESSHVTYRLFSFFKNISSSFFQIDNFHLVEVIRVPLLIFVLKGSARFKSMKDEEEKIVQISLNKTIYVKRWFQHFKNIKPIYSDQLIDLRSLVNHSKIIQSIIF